MKRGKPFQKGSKINNTGRTRFKTGNTIGFTKGYNGRTGAKLTEETKHKIRLSRLGKRNSPKTEFTKGAGSPTWQGGISSGLQRIRASTEYKLWRVSVFQRDNWTCVWCGAKEVLLNADHIKPFSLYPELRFAIDNGRTLCVPCHKTTDSYAGRVRKLKRIGLEVEET